MQMNLLKLYKELLNEYGPQGWWPLIETGYHKGDYSYPNTQEQVFEICIGTILTQNTAWKNVEKAILNLNKVDALNVIGLERLSDGKLRELVKVSGYFNQKAKKLRAFSKFYTQLEDKTPTRKELLEVWGIGPETADSILLYAYKKPEFVVDAYTKRLLLRLGLIDETAKYDEIKTLFEQNLEKDYKLFQEFHALIVEKGKHKPERS
ncbi:endonuclease III domain-containing protein [Candidatus Woesearchaeota archaeon]|nr:endonuclease III domain-containing protein [Candidatus Woesearchaeota archaeon]